MKKIMMLTAAMLFFGVALAIGAGNPVESEVEGAIEDFAQGCEEELSRFCKEVTPGQGRVLACLYAYEDKLSTRCEHALYDSMAKLSRTLTNFSYATGECADDMVSLCSETVVGEGRVLDCLKQNKDKVGKKCLNALKDVGWLK